MGKILKWPDQKTALEEAVEFEKEVGFDAVLVIGIPKGKSGEMYVGLSEGITDPEIVFLLQCAIQRICLETVLESGDE